VTRRHAAAVAWISRLAAVAVICNVFFGLYLASGGHPAFGDEKDVVGTKHDVSIPGTPVCVNCHIPDESGQDQLWAVKPNTAGDFAGLRPLCFSCHDGTVTSVGTFAFDLTRPLHIRTPGVRGADCDRCHDPHGTPYAKFLKLPGNADFCRNCHPIAGPVNHPVDVNARALGINPTDSTWDPYQGDYSGTRLWNADGTGPGDYVKCLTCHNPHGGTPGTQFNTMPVEQLCQNCHKK
jgi:predicted CXXCH cytochrome family protein